MRNNVKKFFGLLGLADAITIDDGAMLTDWETDEPIGDLDNQIVHFTWTDSEFDYSDTLTEGGIAAGVFADSKFVCENYEGERTVLRFFAVENLIDVSGKLAIAPSKPHL